MEVRDYYATGLLPAGGGLVSCGFVRYKSREELQGAADGVRPKELDRAMIEDGELYPVTFVDVNRPDGCVRDGNSYTNLTEAQFIVKTLARLVNDGLVSGTTSIGVITFYQGQVSLLKKVLSRKSCGPSGPETLDDLIKRDIELDIEINTVDGFQGKEKDLVILSCVRCDSRGPHRPSGSNNFSRIGFVADARRLNVAVTRARRCLLIVGSADTLSTDESWGRLIRNLRQRQLIVTPTTSSRR
jgi:senataxin